MASNWSARPLPAGSAAHTGGSRRWTIACARTCSPPIICSPTTRQSRSSIRAVDERRLGGFRSMRVISDHGAGRRRPRRSTSARRTGERPAAHLEHFNGVLHVDGYTGFERMTIRGDVVLAACWAHTRRKFCEVVQTEDTPLAHAALRRIAGLYAVEAQVRGQSSAHRLAARRTLAKPSSTLSRSGWKHTSRICPAAENSPRRCGTHSRAGMG